MLMSSLTCKASPELIPIRSRKNMEVSFLFAKVERFPYQQLPGDLSHNRALLSSPATTGGPGKPYPCPFSQIGVNVVF